MKIRLKLPLSLLSGGFLFTILLVHADSIPYAFTTIAGTAGNSGGLDGTNGGAQFYWPEGLVVDTNGNVYVVDNFENTVRKISPSGTNWIVTTIAGVAGVGGSADGANTASRLNQPTSIALDNTGNLYVTDGGNNTIRKLTLDGTTWTVTTIAGVANGSSGTADGTNSAARFNYPSGIATDTNGNLFVADTDNNTIRKITRNGTNWVVTTIAGKAINGVGSANGTNQVARFSAPSGLTTDVAGNLYVADTSNYTIRKMTPSGTNWIVTTIAGTAGSPGSADGTNGTARFYYPSGIAADTSSNLFVADTYNNTLRKLTLTGTNCVVTTIAGVADGSNGGSSDGTNALFSYPYGIALDAANRIFVGDTLNSTIRLGQITSVPNLTIYFTPPNSVVVSWPNVGNFLLQTNATLTATVWASYGGSPALTNGVNSVILSSATGNLFFRLSR